MQEDFSPTHATPAATNLCEPDLEATDLRLLVDAVRDSALLKLDPAGRILNWTSGAAAIHGYAAEEIVGRPYSTLYLPEDADTGLPERMLQAAQRDGRFEYEGWRLRKDGSRFWANVAVTAQRATEGRLSGFTSVTRDRSERHRYEESLRLSEARFRTLVEGVRDYAIFMLDPGGDIATWNVGAQKIHGFESNETIGTHFSRLLVADGTERERANRELTTATREGRFQEEGWRSRKNGGKFAANVVITSIRNPAGVLLGFSMITRDLTERRQHEAALRESEERFRLLVESVVDYAIVTLDENGMIVTWNSGAQRINGYDAAEIVGRHCSLLYLPEDVHANKPWRQLTTARERGRVNDESWRMRKDGTQYWANNVIATLPAFEGRRGAFYMVTQDLTHRRHAETLADTAQRMHEFIAMLAHELRNPLAPIRNAVALMGRRGLEDPLVESMRLTIDRQSQNLTRIVDELLDVNRIARGQLTIQKEDIDLRDVLARAVETSAPLIDAHGHRLHLSVADHPIDCFGDPLRLAQAVVNILNNAAKYTPDGGDIWLSAEEVGVRAEVRVRDNGRGIERDSIDRVFDLFMQADPAVGSALGGLGVGLALVRRVVELHGGTVQALSDGLGKGSMFVMRLPVATHVTTKHEIEERTDVERGFVALRVLVVDDNEDAANSMATLLQMLGHEVRAVYDGPAAIAMAQQFNPDVAMLDIGMPIMNGYEVARALRAGHARLTLVAVTGWGHEDAKLQAREAGFSRHVVKPVNESTLIELLAEIAGDR